MKIFKKYTMDWWQFGIFKVSLLSFGILIGAYWNQLFLNSQIMLGLGIIFIISTVYIVYVSLKQVF